MSDLTAIEKNLLESEKECPVTFGPLNHPSVMCDLMSTLEPYPWQRAIWDACWRAGAQVAVRTCNGSGKSSMVVPILAVTWAAAFPGSQVVVTSASQDQAQLQLWPAIRSLASRLSGWDAQKERIYAKSVNGIERSVIALRVASHGERFEGFHERWYPDKDGNQHFSPLLIIGDEAKSISNDIWVAIERCDPTTQLMISTTGEDAGDFYDACLNKSGLWITDWEYGGKEFEFKIPWTMCPHLRKGHSYARKSAMLRELGRNHPTTCSILLAEFFRGGTHMVFTDFDLQMAREAMSGLRKHVRGKRIGFCDFSGGGDELTFGVRDGNMIYPIEAWRHDTSTSPSVTARKYIKLFNHWSLSPKQVYGDNGGIGAQIINQLHAEGWPINRVNNESAARDNMGFANCYTEWHWDFKEHLSDIILPRDSILLDQMRLRRFTQSNNDNNRVRLEPKQKARKERAEKSPDRLDTVVGLCLNMEKMAFAGKTENTVTRCGTPVEYAAWARSQENKKPANWMESW